MALKAELEELSSCKAEYSIIKLKQNFYDQDEKKPLKLQAWQIKKIDSERAICNGSDLVNPHAKEEGMRLEYILLKQCV